MNIELLSQLDQRLLALHGGQSHLRLENRCVVPARSSRHGLSCAAHIWPLSGRNSTYPAIQISKASSWLAGPMGVDDDGRQSILLTGRYTSLP
jgi:hypothetical protein